MYLILYKIALKIVLFFFSRQKTTLPSNPDWKVWVSKQQINLSLRLALVLLDADGFKTSMLKNPIFKSRLGVCFYNRLQALHKLLEFLNFTLLISNWWTTVLRILYILSILSLHETMNAFPKCQIVRKCWDSNPGLTPRIYLEWILPLNYTRCFYLSKLEPHIDLSCHTMFL